MLTRVFEPKDLAKLQQRRGSVRKYVKIQSSHCHRPKIPISLTFALGHLFQLYLTETFVTLLLFVSPVLNLPCSCPPLCILLALLLTIRVRPRLNYSLLSHYLFHLLLLFVYLFIYLFIYLFSFSFLPFLSFPILYISILLAIAME